MLRAGNGGTSTFTGPAGERAIGEVFGNAGPTGDRALQPVGGADTSCSGAIEYQRATVSAAGSVRPGGTSRPVINASQPLLSTGLGTSRNRSPEHRAYLLIRYLSRIRAAPTAAPRWCASLLSTARSTTTDIILRYPSSTPYRRTAALNGDNRLMMSGPRSRGGAEQFSLPLAQSMSSSAARANKRCHSNWEAGSASHGSRRAGSATNWQSVVPSTVCSA